MSNKEKTTGKESYSIRTSKDKKGKLETKIIYAPYELLRDKQIIAFGTSGPDGQFEIGDLDYGTYRLQIVINKFLKRDTLFEISKRKTKIYIELNDSLLWNYLDSTGIAKFPYNKETAKFDIENGDIKILTAGLQPLPINASDSVTAKYGFKYLPVAGCVLEPHQDKAIANYNSIVYEYLNKINGVGWRERLGADLKDLYLKLRSENAR